MKKLFIFSLIFVPLFVFGNITQLVFTTDPQTLAPNAVSEKFTVQTQDAGGGAETVGETADLTLTSSSGTGEFSSSNTSWQADNVLTVNSNWSNRSFYYRDNTPGTYTITAEIKTRTSGLSWRATQTIVIDGSGGANGGGNSGTSPSVSSGGGSSNSGDNATSAHSSPASLSNSSNRSELTLSAGRPRLTTIYSPVSFQAKWTHEKNDNSLNQLHWSFGDGAESYGQAVSHAYDRPGRYQVVLTLTQGETEAVARTSVEVLVPDLLMTEVNPDYIRLENRAKQEINLAGWRVAAGEQTFIFPQDTIILPNTHLDLSSSISQLHPTSLVAVQLFYPGGQIALLDPSQNPKTTPANLSELISKLNLALQAKKITKKASTAPTSNKSIVSPAVSVGPAPTKTITLGSERPNQSWWQKLFSR